MKYVFALFFTFLLVGCGDREVSRVEKTYEVVDIKPPKRFYVSLRDTQTGQVYKDLYVSKRCSHWQKLKINSQWKFPEVTYQGRKTYSRVQGYGELCNMIKKMP